MTTTQGPMTDAASTESLDPVDPVDPVDPGDHGDPGDPDRPGTVRPFLAALAVVIACQAVVGLDVAVPVLRPVLALVGFLGVPALVLHRRATYPADNGVSRAIYALGLSVLLVLAGGLLLDAVLPLVGVDRPLAPRPLAVAWLLADGGLLWWRRSVPLLPSGSVRRAAGRVIAARVEPATAVAVAALVLAVLGAVRLNNGAGGTVAIVAAALGALAVLLLQVDGPHALARDSRVLVLVATSFLMSTSLRGWSITGHDIQAEFLAFRLTDHAQAWHPGSFVNAYNACLSVTILPTVLSQISGLSGTVVFKVAPQLIFATTPVMVYLVSRRFTSRRTAVSAAALTFAFPTFFTDMPYLTRQEVAFFFLALMLLAATEPSRTRRTSRILVAVLGSGVILSHYSTTYLLLGALVLALVGMAMMTGLRRLPGLRRAEAGGGREAAMLVHPYVVLPLLVAALVWAGPITHTGGHAGAVLRQTANVITGRSSGGTGSSDTSYALFSGHHTTQQQRMDQFVRASVAYRDQHIARANQLLPSPGSAVLKPVLHDPETAPLTAVGRELDRLGPDPGQVGTGLKLLAAGLMQVVAVVGLLLLLRRRRKLPPDTPWPPREIAFLAWATMATLGLVVVIPNLSVEYGVLRAFQQTLLVLAPLMALGLRALARPVRALAPRTAGVLVGLAPVVLMLILTGVVPAVLGGDQQRLAFANSGSYYDKFYADDAELNGIRWLGAVDHADTTNERIIASRNIDARLLVLSDNRAPIADRLFPTVLSKDAYVFVDSQILRKGDSTVFYTGDSLTYTYPLFLLDQHLDLLYSSPDGRVYR